MAKNMIAGQPTGDKYTNSGEMLLLPAGKISPKAVLGIEMPAKKSRPGLSRKKYDPYTCSAVVDPSAYAKGFESVVYPEGLEQAPGRENLEIGGEYHMYTVLRAKCPCPRCGGVSSSKNGTYTRDAVWLPPRRGQPCRMHISVQRMLCKNPDCRKSYHAPIPGVPTMRRSSEDVLSQACSRGLQGSASDAEAHMLEEGVPISRDTILRTIDMASIPEPTEDELRFLGVDDVAERKGCVYDTAVYSGLNHAALALLKGRDGSALREWLQEKGASPVILARDRGTGMATAAGDNDIDTLQVADPWHLYKNATDHVKDALKDALPEHLFLVNGVLAEGTQRKVDTSKIDKDDPRVAALDGRYGNTAPIDEDGHEIRVEILDDIDSRKNRQQAANRKEKKVVARAIREEYRAGGVSKAELARRHGMSVGTLCKRLAMTDEEVDAMDQVNRRKKMRSSAVDDYRNIVYKMLADGVSPPLILAWCLRAGYSASPTTLARNIVAIARNHLGMDLSKHSMLTERYPPGVEAISLYEIRRYMASFNRTSLSDLPVSKCYRAIKSRYPIVQTCEDFRRDFYWTIKGSETKWLDTFIGRYREGVFGNFVKGILMDREAIENTIKYSVSSGFVEGMNDSFKLLKRKVYGRADTDLLDRKFRAVSCLRHRGMTVKQLLFPTS